MTEQRKSSFLHTQIHGEHYYFKCTLEATYRTLGHRKNNRKNNILVLLALNWKSIEEYIKHCAPCQKAQRKPKLAQLTPLPKTIYPNERVHVDLYGPLRGDHNYKYVAVITCVKGIILLLFAN
jgi:hypothetical protein